MDKRCKASRSHKPHLWSRTTRRTVTEVTPGDTFSCPGSAVTGRTEKDIRGDQIREDARSGRNWAEAEAASSNSPTGPYGATCICGAGRRTLFAATALQGVHGRPTGLCARHPGGTVHRESDWKK